MTMRNPPSWLQQGSHPAENDRLVSQSVMRSRATVASEPALRVTQSSPVGMTITVAAGGGFIAGTNRANQGYYHVYNDSNLVINVASSDPSLARIDYVVAKVEDADIVGSNNTSSIVVLQGVASASPVAPTVPDNAIILARLNITAASVSVTTGSIVDFRSIPAFGTIPVRNQTDRDALTLYPGIRVFRLDTGVEESNPTGIAASWVSETTVLVGSWTPTFTNFNATPTVSSARFRITTAPTGKWVEAKISIIFNSAATGQLVISMPFTAASSNTTGQVANIGTVTGLRQGVGFQTGSVFMNSLTAISFQGIGTTAWASTTPHTWASTDQLQATFMYEAA